MLTRRLALDAVDHDHGARALRVDRVELARSRKAAPPCPCRPLAATAPRNAIRLSRPRGRAAAVAAQMRLQADGAAVGSASGEQARQARRRRDTRGPFVVRRRSSAGPRAQGSRDDAVHAVDRQHEREVERGAGTAVKDGRHPAPRRVPRAARHRCSAPPGTRRHAALLDADAAAGETRPAQPDARRADPRDEIDPDGDVARAVGPRPDDRPAHRRCKRRPWQRRRRARPADWRECRNALPSPPAPARPGTRRRSRPPAAAPRRQRSPARPSTHRPRRAGAARQPRPRRCTPRRAARTRRRVRRCPCRDCARAQSATPHRRASAARATCVGRREPAAGSLRSVRAAGRKRPCPGRARTAGRRT